MLDIFVCHSPADRAIAQQIEGRLTRCAEATVSLDYGVLREGERIPELWDRGLSSGGILLLLSPESVPPKADRRPWESLLAHLESRERPPIASVLLSDCPFPALLRRKRFFEWPEHAREIQGWAVGLHHPASTFTPLEPLQADVKPDIVEDLFRRLVDGTGVVKMPCGDATAREFARQAAPYFRDVFWIECSERSRTSVFCEIAFRLGLKLSLTEQNPAASVLRSLEHHRILVVLNGLDMTAMKLSDDACTSVLINETSGPTEDVDAKQVTSLIGLYGTWSKNIDECHRLFPRMEPALNWAYVHNWDLGVQLAKAFFSFLMSQDRQFEAIDIMRDLGYHARSRKDKRIVEECDSELSWLTWSRPPAKTPDAAPADQLSLF